HAPTMTTIKPGVVSVKLASGKVDKYVVFGGFADILPTGCTLLAEAAMPLSEVSQATLQKRIEAAQAELADVTSDEHKTKLELYLAELPRLVGGIAPAWYGVRQEDKRAACGPLFFDLRAGLAVGGPVGTR